MKKMIFILIFLFTRSLSFCQSNFEIGNIALSVVMPENIEGLDASDVSKLKTKITQIATNGGLAASGYNHNFIIFPKLALYQVNLVETGLQNITVIETELSIFIKCVDNNLVFSTVSKLIRSTGTNKKAAIINAISQINVKDSSYLSFIENGKKKIIAYYESTCQDIIDNSDALIKNQDYQQAIGLLLSIPKEVGCYKKAINKSVEAYKAYQNQKCSELVLNAKTQIAANNYNAALNILSNVDPSTSCKKEAEGLIKQIEPKVDAIEREKAQFRNKIYNDAVELEKQRIAAAKEIAKAYYNRTQPPYNYLYIIK